jgi:hypothetical protein
MENILLRVGTTSRAFFTLPLLNASAATASSSEHLDIIRFSAEA